MTHATAIFVVAAMLAALPPTARAAEPPAPGPAPAAASAAEPLPSTTNAALAYWRVWAGKPDGLPARLDETFNGRELSWSPASDLARFLQENQAYVDRLVAASKIPSCDWQLAYADGIAIVLPHLDRIRESARLLVADCRWHWTEGRADVSFSRCEALLAMSRHVSGDKMVVSSMVGQGLARMALDEMKRYAASGKLTPDQRARLERAIEPLASPDPFAFAHALRMEGRMNVAYCERFTGAQAGLTLYREIERGGEPIEQAQAVRAMDAPALRAAGERVAAYTSAAADAWNAPDPHAALQALETRVLTGDFGPLAVLMAAGYSRTRATFDEHVALVREVRAALAPSANTPGPPAPAPPGP